MSDNNVPTSNDGNISTLPAFGADAKQVSVSGLSSGGFMTAQLHVTYSKHFMGAGILAAGPYFCAGGKVSNTYLTNAETTCMQPITPSTGPSGKNLYKMAKVFAEPKDPETPPKIDSLTNLVNDRIYVSTGSADIVVNSSVVEQVCEFYKAAGIPDENILFKTTKAGHAILTNNPFDHECSVTEAPYINNGGFFHSYHLLNHIYNLGEGEDFKDISTQASGEVITFDQHEFIRQSLPANLPEEEQERRIKLTSMSKLAFAYIPPNVDKNTRVHVALHGCEQGYTVIGSDYFLTTGYNQIAAKHNIIVLYPQAQKSDTEPYNPKGCWDFWGYSSPNPWAPDFYTKDALQMKAIIAMVKRLTEPKAPAKKATPPAKKAEPATPKTPA